MVAITGIGDGLIEEEDRRFETVCIFFPTHICLSSN